MKEIVICSAVKFNGKILRGHRHADCFSTARRMRIDTTYSKSNIQGFITSENRFVDRKEGYQIQKNAGIPSFIGQTHPKEAYLNEELYSEDLY